MIIIIKSNEKVNNGCRLMLMEESPAKHNDTAVYYEYMIQRTIAISHEVGKTARKMDLYRFVTNENVKAGALNLLCLLIMLSVVIKKSHS